MKIKMKIMLLLIVVVLCLVVFLAVDFVCPSCVSGVPCRTHSGGNGIPCEWWGDE